MQEINYNIKFIAINTEITTYQLFSIFIGKPLATHAAAVIKHFPLFFAFAKTLRSSGSCKTPLFVASLVKLTKKNQSVNTIAIYYVYLKVKTETSVEK